MMKNDTILIVDDMEINRLLLHELFGSEHNVIEACNGVEAMELICQQKDNINLILLDIMMPKKDGYEVLDDMQKEGLIGKIPVIVITAIDSMQSEVKALERGASDLILKPFDPKVVKARVESALNSYYYKKQMELTIQAQKKFINQSYMAMIDTLKMIVVHRNMESGQHIQCIQMYTKILLDEVAEKIPKYGIDKKMVKIISKAAMLHDVGKIVIPDNILNKPGRLTTEEFEIMKSHSIEGCKILYGLNQMGNREFLECAYDICRHHHERYDGKGYPDGLKGDEIALSAQVVGIADVYDALVNERIYKPAYQHEEAVKMILGGECGEFSPEILKCFQCVSDKFKSTLNKYKGQTTEVEEDVLFNDLIGFLSEEENDLNLETDSYKYYALLQYLDSTVFEVDFKSGEYIRVYPTYSEFSYMKADGNFERDFIKFLNHSVLEEKREEIMQWVYSSWKQLERHESTSITTQYELFNQIYQNYKWYSISFLLIEGNIENHERFLAIFKSLDNKKEVKIKNNLIAEENTQKDILTGVFSNEAFQRISKRILEEYASKQHCVLIINLDNFNYMNNIEGRIYGDEILCRFAQILKVEFKEDCVIGRMGGDEFAVFMTNIAGRDFIEWRIKKLMNEVTSSLRSEEEPLVTVSIGASVFPKDGQELDILHIKAKKALATAKNFGKKQYRIYSAKIEENVGSITKNMKLNKNVNLISCFSAFNNQLTSYFLNKQEEEFIPTMFDLVARHFSLSHVVAYESMEQEVLYQWNANAFRNLSLPNAELVQGIFKEKEEIVCSDVTMFDKEYREVLNQYGITACIIMPITYINKKEEFTILLMGWDTGIHHWSGEEIESAKILVKVIAKVLKQKYLEEQLERSHQLNQFIFKSNNTIGYAVDAGYHIIEVSKSMEKIYDVQVGGKCYSQLYKLDSPCADCPIKKLNRVQTEVFLKKNMPESKEPITIKATAFPMGKTETVYLLMEE